MSETETPEVVEPEQPAEEEEPVEEEEPASVEVEDEKRTVRIEP